MSYTLVLTATSGAQADSIAVNTATAKLMQDNSYPSGQEIIFHITGSALFTNGQTQISGVTGANGVVSVSFTDKISETVYIFAALSGDATVSATAQSVFSASPDGDNEIMLNVIVDNAKADGVAKNQLELLVRSKSTLQPVSDMTCVFDIHSGRAIFDNGSKSISGVTNAGGSCFAYLTDTAAESVPVTVSVPGNLTQTQTVTFTAGDVLRISSVSTLNDKQFSPETPTVAWIGAQFRILTSGGSGQVNWSVEGSGLAVQSLLRDGVQLQFTESADTDVRYTVTGTDVKTGEVVTYSFILEDYYVSFGSLDSISDLYLNGSTHYIPSPAQLHNLYSQWGTMSAYQGWTEKKDIYWTNQFNIVTEATVFNVSTNQESNEILDILRLNCFAKLSRSSD